MLLLNANWCRYFCVLLLQCAFQSRATELKQCVAQKERKKKSFIYLCPRCSERDRRERRGRAQKCCISTAETEEAQTQRPANPQWEPRNKDPNRCGTKLKNNISTIIPLLSRSLSVFGCGKRITLHVRGPVLFFLFFHKMWTMWHPTLNPTVLVLHTQRKKYFPLNTFSLIFSISIRPS